ncbi:helicase-associated domain-containing protein [Salinibacterium sp. ZJ450]|uniref:helicase-associated domain-containing protein n=1 Tax=Salinibacterium sp. ZJ450 TaxID=2708338 RepID=UPI00141F2CB5|nr:helicase-associated domain-containing protein [Salinibacterium sp. ZJ450]
MPANSSASLALASRLRTLDDQQLETLLSAREVRDSGIRDFFDLADALLERASIQSALGRLDRPTLAVIATVSELPAPTAADVAAALPRIADVAALLSAAVELALIDTHAGRYSAYEPVHDLLHGWPSLGLPSSAALVTEAPPSTLDTVVQDDLVAIDRASADRAFATTGALAALLSELAREPARPLVRGGLGLPDLKRLGEAMRVPLDDVTALHGIAERAELIALEAEGWLPTADAGDWMLRSSVDRWGVLVEAWHSHLAPDIRRLLDERAHSRWSDSLLDYVAWLYPAGRDWMRDRVHVYSRDAELLGIAAHDTPSTPGKELLTGDAQAAVRAMATLFPAEVDRVYVQHDLSVISPGPLAPRLDARLRAIADVESRSLAASYRITQGSLTRGLASGETEESIRALLTEMSLTGIPQPLDYLITETAARYGALRVGAIVADTDPGDADYGARSYVRSDDTHLLGMLAVDQSLSALSLVRSGEHRLVSRFDQDVVFWGLSEARYPVAAEDAAGQPITLRRRSATRSKPVPPSDAVSLVEKLRIGTKSEPKETGQAWLARQLDVAVRAKLTVTVTVRMPDGRDVDYLLEPTAIAGGRLRARDRRADLERTLPLSHITAVTPAGA